MESSQLLGPAVLFALMIVVGLQLTPQDFRRVLEAPRTVIGGTLGQLVFLPLMTWSVVSGLGLSPGLGAGAFLLAASPGAAMSNVMTAVARAHVALSVTLTAVSSVLAVVTLPVLTALGIWLFLGDSAEIEVPVGMLVNQLVMFLLIPIGLGMWLRARRPEAAVRYISRVNRIAVIGIVGLSAYGAIRGGENLPTGAELLWAGAGTILWTFAAMAIASGIAVLLRLDAEDRFTLLIEFSARNIALAVVIAISTLQRLDLALFGAIYSMTGFPIVIGLSVLRGRWAKVAEPVEELVSSRAVAR